MVDFMCLPTELLLQVASYLHPYFYLDLALACKVLHKVLASGLAIHGAKYANWRNINLCSLDPPLDEASQRPNARTFLTKLIKEPDFVQYVESVDMDADASNFDDGTSHLNPWARIPTEKPAAADMALWKLSLSRNAILRKQKDSLDEASEVDDTDFSEGVEEIAARVSRAEQETAYVISFEAGYPAALMAHALCLCPELRALRFVPYVNNTSMMLHMLRNVSTLYKQQKMLHTPGLISPRDGIQLLSRVPELPFQRLTRVDLEHWDTEGGVDLEWVILFIKLPSLKKFYGRMIAESDSDLEGECGGYSQVTELSLEYSNIADDQWPYLFGEIADLKKFEYEYGGAIISYHEWDSFSTVGALQKYAGETLEELRLWISPDADDYVCNIAAAEQESLINIAAGVSGRTSFAERLCQTRDLLL